MTTDHVAPRIYVACLASYNAGTLHGAWIDAAQDADDIRADIARMLRASPYASAEEWAVHDYEGFEPWDMGEHPDLEHVAAIGCALESDPDTGAALCAYVAYHDDPEYAEGFASAYCGEWASEREFADNLAGELGIIPDDPNNLAARYFDYDAWRRDVFMGDYYSVRAPGGNVFVFDTRG